LARQAKEERLAVGVLEVEHHRLLVRVQHHERVGLHLTLSAPDDVAFGPLDLEHPGAHEAEQQAAVGAVVDLAEIQHEHALERAADLIRGRHDFLAPQALAGMIIVFTPCPAAAWANASPIRSSGNRAVTRRLRPSFGISVSARRYAVPRPNALPILISRKWTSQRSSGKTLPFGFTPTSWKKPLERVSASASLTSSGLPTASQTTSAPRPCVSSITRSLRLSRAGSITTAAPRLRAIFRRSAPGGALRAFSAAVGGLAADRATHKALTDAAAHLADDAGILVAEHERRLPRKQALSRVDVRAADPGGVDGDDDLTGPGDGLRGCVDGEAALALPGGDLHLGTSPAGCRVVARLSELR